jgi:hypothetical protein
MWQVITVVPYPKRNCRRRTQRRGDAGVPARHRHVLRIARFQCLGQPVARGLHSLTSQLNVSLSLG